MNKVIWITGASSGIGEALALAYAEQGAKLIISARNEKALESVKANSKNPENVKVLPLDLEDTDALPGKINEALALFGRVDTLINSGGISQRSLAMETNLATEQRLMTINFWGTAVLSKALIPAMIAKGGGQIVCISSLVGKFGTRYRSAYSASKHALHGYFDSLRSELFEQNIKITIVCPGFIKTNVSINALTATGAAQGTMDDAQHNGMSAEVFANKALLAIKAGKEEVYIGGKETYGVLLKRFLPGIFSKVVRKAKVI